MQGVQQSTTEFEQMLRTNQRYLNQISSFIGFFSALEHVLEEDFKLCTATKPFFDEPISQV